MKVDDLRWGWFQMGRHGVPGLSSERRTSLDLPPERA